MPNYLQTRSTPLLPVLFALTVSLLAACTPVPPANQVVTVIDGDSFILRNADGNEQTIDLGHIDAPEREQPFGREAKNFVKEKLLNKTITISPDNAVTVEGENLNILLLRQGVAWHRPENSESGATFESQFAYNEAQTEAMNNQTGLWGLEHGLRVPPWVWRQQATERSDNPMQRKRMMRQKFDEMMERRKQQEQQAAEAANKTSGDDQ